jgi:membrane protein
MKPTVLKLIKEAGKEFGRNKPLLMGAAISFYIILSLGPILVLSIISLGAVLGEQVVKGQLIEEISRSVGEKPAEIIRNLISKAHQFPSKTATVIASIPLIFFGCTMIFYQIKISLDIIWKAGEPEMKLFSEKVKIYLFSFLMLLIVGAALFLLIIKSPIINTLRENIITFLPMPALFYWLLDFLFTFSIITLLFSLVYKILPDRKLEWKESLIGGAVTSFFFTIVQILVSINISLTEIDSALGAFGSYTILTLWIFYSSLVFLFGANFTKVYHDHSIKNKNK